jgi:glycosyltransferase involved in cell wall biosynthesis
MTGKELCPARHILMTTDTIGGVWSYALHLAEALGRRGCRVTLAAMGAPLRPSQRAEAARVPGLALYESGYRLEWMDDPWDDVARAGEWLLQLEDALAPDVVHLNGYAHGALPWRAPALVVGHSCVSSWWEAARGCAPPAGWEQYRQAVAHGLRRAAMVVAPSRTMLEALRRHYGWPATGRVIYNGRDLQRFAPGRKQPLVLTAGRLWDEGKNVAALELVAPLIPWPIYAAGAEQHPAGGRMEASHLQLLGCLDTAAMAAWYGRAAIYALPARYEPFGLSVLEAALAGCALVLGDIPSLRELWPEAALFVPPDDHQALRAALLCLIADERLRLQLAARAQERARSFTTERMVAGYLGLYAELRQQLPAPPVSLALGAAGGMER